MKTIHKKILPQYMDDVIRGRKTFEIRKDEDDIQVGDIIVLEEWCDGKYLNVSVSSEVTYVLRNCPEYGLKDGYCVIGLACNSNLIYNKGRADVIDEFATELKSRLLDAITKEHLESVTNLLNDVAEIVKEKQNE